MIFFTGCVGTTTNNSRNLLPLFRPDDYQTVAYRTWKTTWATFEVIVLKQRPCVPHNTQALVFLDSGIHPLTTNIIYSHYFKGGGGYLVDWTHNRQKNKNSSTIQEVSILWLDPETKFQSLIIITLSDNLLMLLAIEFLDI